MVNAMTPLSLGKKRIAAEFLDIINQIACAVEEVDRRGIILPLTFAEEWASFSLLASQIHARRDATTLEEIKGAIQKLRVLRSLVKDEQAKSANFEQPGKGHRSLMQLGNEIESCIYRLEEVRNQFK